MIDIAKEWWRGTWQGLLAGAVIIGLAALAYGGVPNRIADADPNTECRVVSDEEQAALFPYLIPVGDLDMPGPGQPGGGGSCQPISCSITCVGGPCSAGPCNVKSGWKASCICGASGACSSGCVSCRGSW